jgi:hypothetical protein
MRNAPAMRLRGRSARLRAYRIGRWDRDSLAEVTAACRSSNAMDKALAESVSAARRDGRTGRRSQWHWG